MATRHGQAVIQVAEVFLHVLRCANERNSHLLLQLNHGRRLPDIVQTIRDPLTIFRVPWPSSCQTINELGYVIVWVKLVLKQ